MAAHSDAGNDTGTTAGLARRGARAEATDRHAAWRRLAGVGRSAIDDTADTRGSVIQLATRSRYQDPSMQRTVVTLLWRTIALSCVAIGLVGIAVPGLPTVPLMLVAAWAAGHGWPRLEKWLLDHAHFGPPIRRWREGGIVPRKVKWFASVAMLTSCVILWQLEAALWFKVTVPAVLLGVTLWLWRAPES